MGIGDWRMTVIVRRWAVSVPARAWTRSQRIDLGSYTLALAAQQVICTAPLLVAMSPIVRRLGGGSADTLIQNFLGITGEGADTLRELFHPQGVPDRFDLPLEFVLAVAFATGTAATMQRVVELIWNQPRAPWTSWWRQLLWVCALVPSLAAAMLLTHAGHRHAHHVPNAVVSSVFAGIGTFAFYWWTQHLLLLGKVSWKRLLPGSLLIGVGVGVTVAAAHFLLADQLLEEVTDYGLVGVSVVMTAWIAVFTSVVVVGALLGAVIVEHRERRPLGLRRRDKVVQEEVTTTEVHLDRVPEQAEEKSSQVSAGSETAERDQ